MNKLDYNLINNIIEPYTRKIINNDLLNDIKNFVKKYNSLLFIYNNNNVSLNREVIHIWIAKDLLEYCSLYSIYPVIKKTNQINILNMDSKKYYKNTIISYESLMFIDNPKNEYKWGKNISRTIFGSLTIKERSDFLDFVISNKLKFRRFHPDFY